MQDNKPKRNILSIIFLLLCFIGSAVAGAMFASSGVFDSENTARKVVGLDDTTELIKAKDKSIVLIMGVDKREDDVGRSDTMMIATIDPRLDQATLLSIPRDTRVRIYGRGFDKINAAFSYGGVKLSAETVEDFLGIDIDHYVLIDTNSFIKIIDAIGGVDIDVEKRMYYEDPWDDNGGLVIDLYPGEQHMDGKTAVTYVRYRDSEGDIGRVQRQQKFMEACMDKVTSPEIVPRIPKIVREIIDAVETDMSLRQLLELAGSLKAAQKNGLETDMVPGYPLYIDDISYWIPYVDELRISVADALGIAVDPYMRERFERAAREYNESIPNGAKDIPDGEDNIGNPIRNSRRNIEERSTIRESRYSDERRSYDDDRTTYNERRSYDDDRTTYNERRSYDDDRTTYNDRRSYDDDRTTYNERRSYDDDRTTYNERRSYDDDRTTYNERRSYDDDRTTSTDRRSYDDDRTTSTDRRSYDDDRTTSTDRRSYDEPQIERRTIPEVDEAFNEPTRDEAPKTRY